MYFVYWVYYNERILDITMNMRGGTDTVHIQKERFRLRVRHQLSRPGLSPPFYQQPLSTDPRLLEEEVTVHRQQ